MNNCRKSNESRAGGDAALCLIAFLWGLACLLSNLAYTWVDPRIRLGHSHATLHGRFPVHLMRHRTLGLFRIPAVGQRRGLSRRTRGFRDYLPHCRDTCLSGAAVRHPHHFPVGAAASSKVITALDATSWIGMAWLTRAQFLQLRE